MMISSSGSFSETTSNASSIQVLLFIIELDGWRNINDMVAIGNSILLRNLENNSAKKIIGTLAAYTPYEIDQGSRNCYLLLHRKGDWKRSKTR
jgi:hypothetical protein